jgi:hypothetical protein
MLKIQVGLTSEREMNEEGSDQNYPV